MLRVAHHITGKIQPVVIDRVPLPALIINNDRQPIGINHNDAFRDIIITVPEGLAFSVKSHAVIFHQSI